MRVREVESMTSDSLRKNSIDELSLSHQYSNKRSRDFSVTFSHSKPIKELLWYKVLKEAEIPPTVQRRGLILLFHSGVDENEKVRFSNREGSTGHSLLDKALNYYKVIVVT
ncbi:hypothetical protein NPIL_680341 [Nephila pilipes]|uniref:Uncharacterized protein n=1 Tax=Nephila pilipes TaxID=299642 RepID=A0A8X6QZL7_NEPPI|nr:hypothetical protein NPIL_680341 [Nephila pilipes]